MIVFRRCFPKREEIKQVYNNIVSIKIEIMGIRSMGLGRVEKRKKVRRLLCLRVRKILWIICLRRKIISDIFFGCLYFVLYYFVTTIIIKQPTHKYMLLKTSPILTLFTPTSPIFSLFSTTIHRNYILHPNYLSPSYTQLQYSPYYYNKANQLQMFKINTSQINQNSLNKFLSQQIQNDRMKFLKTKEIVFMGRSNVGKSSIINAVFGGNGKQKIARVSKRPGTTQFLHFHEAVLGVQKLMIVDAPGYGFANINKARRRMWMGLIDEYLKISSRLCQIFLCINFQHGLKPSDIETLQKISRYNIKIQPILCKSDRISQQHFLPKLKSINEQIRRLEFPNISNQLLICNSKNNFGIDVIKCKIIDCLENSKTRNIDGQELILLEYLKENRVQGKDNAVLEGSVSKPHVVRKLIYNSKLTKYLV